MSLRTIISIHNNAVLFLILFAALAFLQGCPKKADPTPVPRTYDLPDLDTGSLPDGEDLPDGE